ncbi:MAG: hypothetical protein V4507_13230 [Verrucomicrobiota bacterium]
MKSLATPRFWTSFEAIPQSIRKTAAKQFRFWRENQSHPSLQFKKVGLFWSARVNDDYRALCYFKNETYYWFWIGKHSEYEKILRSK